MEVKESALDKFLNNVFMVTLVLGAIGVGGYYYLKKKYGDKFENIFNLLK